MTDTQKIFKRYEMKYLITSEQRKELRSAISSHMHGDEYGRSTINNIYFDTPTSLIIRRSLERPRYKEKLRLRSYGVADDDSEVYVELKKKYDGVVYKRRVGMAYGDALSYLCGGGKPEKSGQIINEIDYFLRYYENIGPAMAISYDRIAYYGNDDRDLRVTFDDNILWRDDDLSLDIEPYGIPIISEGQSLMEIKVSTALPMWLVGELENLNIYKTSFSKYGSAYMDRRAIWACREECGESAQKTERRISCA